MEWNGLMGLVTYTSVYIIFHRPKSKFTYQIIPPLHGRCVGTILNTTAKTPPEANEPQTVAKGVLHFEFTLAIGLTCIKE